MRNTVPSIRSAIQHVASWLPGLLAIVGIACGTTAAAPPPVQGPAPATRPAEAGPRSATQTPASPSGEIEGAIARAIEILLARQESLDGTGASCEWPYEGVYRVPDAGGTRQIPLGYRIGGTAISAWALIEAPGWETHAPRREAVERATTFLLAALADPRMNAKYEHGYDVRNWGHIYALQFLLRLRARAYVSEAARDAVDETIAALVDTLNATAIRDSGGWNYARTEARPVASTFMTAPALQSLWLANACGEVVDAEVTEHAIECIVQARLESGAFQYAVNPGAKSGQGYESVPGAAARMPLCESTLFLAGRGSYDRIRASLDGFFEHWQHLEDRRRQSGTHAKPYMIAPYYFYFAHFYAAQAIELLPTEERAPYRRKLYARIFQVREGTGGWNDRVFDRSENFGTAMILLALLQPNLEPPAAWQSERESK